MNNVRLETNNVHENEQLSISNTMDCRANLVACNFMQRIEAIWKNLEALGYGV